MYSQISAQSADEIVTSLIVGIDEKLDDILTPTGNRNSLKLDAYHKPVITPCTCFYDVSIPMMGYMLCFGSECCDF